MFQILDWVILSLCFLHQKCMLSQLKELTISYRSFKNFDENKFYIDLQAVLWDLIHLFDDTDDVLDIWNISI